MNEIDKNKYSDILLEHYRLNDNYHNSKDNLVWLSSSLYLTFIISSIGWLIAQQKLCINQKIAYSVILLVITALAISYIISQNWYKAKSVYIASLLNELFMKLDTNEAFKVEDIIESINPNLIDITKTTYKMKRAIKYIINNISNLESKDTNRHDDILAKAKDIETYISSMPISNKRRCIKVHIFWENGKIGAILSIAMSILAFLEMLLIW